MKPKLLLAGLSAALLASVGTAFAQDAPQNNSDSVANKWPLAAKAGVDSYADTTPPPGAVNKGPYNDKAWIRGHAYDPPGGGSPIWNPVKLKMMQGGKITSVTVPADSNPTVYCEAANSGVDYIWTEVQHGVGSWSNVYDEWSACPHAKAVPGVRVPNANEYDEQHAMDMGALVLVIPTVRSVAEAKEAVKWAFFPPLGGRSGGQELPFWGGVPGGYHQTINDNLVMVLMIETLDGLKDANQIAKVPGVSALFAASGDLGNFGGYNQGDPDYEREINMVHDAALRAHIPLWGPWAWNGRPDFVGFQGPGGAETGNLLGPEARLPVDFLATEKKTLGPLWMTQGKPTVGPYAPGWVEPKNPN